MGRFSPEILTEVFPKKARATSAFMTKRLSPKIAQSANRASFCGSRSLCGCAVLDLWFARFRKTRGGRIFGCLMFLANLSFLAFDLWRKVKFHKKTRSRFWVRTALSSVVGRACHANRKMAVGFKFGVWLESL